jgi:hypothetical protein
MAVQSDTSRISYAGNNSTSTSYAVPFVFFENSHLKAIAKTSAGVESVVTLTNHTGAGNVSGGTVRTSVAIPATSTLTIYRDVPITQTTTYAEGGDFPAASHERALDKLTQITQQLDRELGQTIRMTEAMPLNPLPVPTGSQQYVLSTTSGQSPSWQPTPSLATGPITATGSTEPRFLADRFADAVNVKDFGAVGDGITDNTSSFQNAITGVNGRSLIVPVGQFVNGLPSAVVGQDILWEYIDGGNSANVNTLSGNRGGIFSDFDCKAKKVLIGQFATPQTPIQGNGSFRDVLFCNAADSDTTNYTSIGQTVTHAIRGFVSGTVSSGAYVAQYKDLVGCYFSAIGNIQWESRGCSAITADATQLGVGIASNEFAVNNPTALGGSVAQSKSMAAVQAIVRSRFADENASHYSRGVLITNHGLRITNGIELLSVNDGTYTSHYANGINMKNAVISNAAITMPQSSSGNTGTVIEYDANDYSVFDRANNRFNWVVGGSASMILSSTGACIGSGATPPSSALHVLGDLTLQSATTSVTSSTTSGGASLPALAAGYLVVSINGTSRKIPFFAS